MDLYIKIFEVLFPVFFSNFVKKLLYRGYPRPFLVKKPPQLDLGQLSIILQKSGKSKVGYFSQNEIITIYCYFTGRVKGG